MGISAPEPWPVPVPGTFPVPGCPCPGLLVCPPPLLLLVFPVPLDCAIASAPEKTSRKINFSIFVMPLSFFSLMPAMEAGELPPKRKRVIEEKIEIKKKRGDSPAAPWLSWRKLFGRRSCGAGSFLALLTTLVPFFRRLGFGCAGCRRFLTGRQRLRVQRTLVTPGLRHDKASAQEQGDHQGRNLLHSILRSDFLSGSYCGSPPGKPASACRDLLPSVNTGCAG